MIYSFIQQKNYNIFWDFYNFIPKECDVWVEIGSGNGDYLVEIADRNKDKIIIGVEIKYKRLLKTLRKIKKRDLSNVILFHCSGEIFTNFILKDNTISAVIINFPDPWFKKRHHKRKIFNLNFLNDLLPKFKSKGKLYIATDQKSYAYQIYETASNINELKNLNNSPFGEKWLYKDVFTKYEKDFINEGKEIYYLEFEVNRN